MLVAIGMGSTAGTSADVVVMSIGGFAVNGAMDAGVGVGITDGEGGKGGTVAAGVPAPTGETSVTTETGTGAKLVGVAAGPMRRGLPPLTGAVLAGADAREATAGKLMGRVPVIGEATPSFAGGQGNPAMRYRVQSGLSSAKACAVKPATAVKMHSGTQRDTMRRPAPRISGSATMRPNQRLCRPCEASPALPCPGGLAHAQRRRPELPVPPQSRPVRWIKEFLFVSRSPSA